jgi:hypothetical protein
LEGAEETREDEKMKQRVEGWLEKKERWAKTKR